MRVKVAERNTGATSRGELKLCAKPNCKDRTWEGKDYCTNHVGMNTYAAHLLKIIAERNAEDKFALRRGTNRSLSLTQMRHLELSSCFDETARHRNGVLTNVLSTS